MTETAARPGTREAVPIRSDVAAQGPARKPLDQDWRRVASMGGICALALVFVALIGMPVGLDDRPIIEPILSMGYLSLLWIPLVIGYVVITEPTLEGVLAPAKGVRDLLAGLFTGVIGGLGLGFLVVLIDNFDLRDPLVNWSPQLFDLLTFENGVAFGILIWALIAGGLGFAGAALHLLPPLARRVVTVTLLVVLGVSILETAVSDLLEGLRLDAVNDVIYANRGGLTFGGAVLLAVVAIAAVLGRAWLAKRSESVPTLRQRYEVLDGFQRQRATLAILAGSALLLVLVPLVLGTIVNELLANVGLFILLALGLNIVVGLAGILDLGYVAFFAVGGYTTAVLTSPNSPKLSPELPWFVAILVVVVIAAIVGLLIGAPVIRMRGDYLAIVTLGFGEIIRLLFLSDWLSPYFGGAQGITNIPGASVFGIFDVRGVDPRSVFYLVMFFSAIAIYVSWRLERSRIGRAWMAIREDEKVAEAMGIDTVNAKLLAFVVGAVLASFSGAIFAAKVGSIFPSSFLILVSIIILVVVIVGGMGNIAGVLVGAVVLIGILGGPKQPGLLQEFSEFKLLIYGALLVWMMLKRPEGLVPNVRRSRELHQEEFLQDAWLGRDDDDDAPDPAGAPV